MTCDVDALTFGDFYFGNPGQMDRLVTLGLYGQPAAGMIDGGYTIPVTRGEDVVQLSSGGVAVSKELDEKRSWVLNASALSPDDMDLLLGYQAGLLGDGPFCLVDPAFRNQLGMDISTMGKRIGAPLGWTAPAGQTLITDPTVPGSSRLSGVGRWHSAGNGSILVAGSQTGGVLEVDTGSAPPMLADQPTSVRFRVRTATGTASVAARVAGRRADLTVHTDVTGTDTTVTSAGWTDVTVEAAAGAFTGCEYLTPALVCRTAGAPDLLVSTVDLQYTDTLLPWLIGHGVARVLITAPMPVAVLEGGRSTPTLTLAEM